MPVHDYISEAGETISQYVPANAPTIDHQQQTRDGKVYKRVYSAPLMATNLATRHGDGTEADFRRCTTDKKCLKVGDMWEISAEMSAKRRQRDGVDQVEEAYFDNYEKEHGVPHMEREKRQKLAKANKALGEWGINVNL